MQTVCIIACHSVGYFVVVLQRLFEGVLVGLLEQSLLERTLSSFDRSAALFVPSRTHIVAAMASGSNIGMMDQAYFVGRKEIVAWLNTTFKMSLQTIEETASGAVACQVLDAIFPGDVAMSKVRWDAKSPHEFIDNYKLIQSVFEKKGIDKHVEVERLMRGKYQDNLENMQWFKSFFGRNYGGQPYDPVARRAKGRGADHVPAFAGAAAAHPVAAASSARAPSKPASAHPGAAPRKSSAADGDDSLKQEGKAAPTQARAPSGTPAGSGGGAALRSHELAQQVDDLRLSVESLEKERVRAVCAVILTPAAGGSPTFFSLPLVHAFRRTSTSASCETSRCSCSPAGRAGTRPRAWRRRSSRSCTRRTRTSCPRTRKRGPRDVAPSQSSSTLLHSTMHPTACAFSALSRGQQRLELVVLDLAAAVGVHRVDELLDVDRQAEVVLDHLHQRRALHAARLVGVAAARDERVDCRGRTGRTKGVRKGPTSPPTTHPRVPKLTHVTLIIECRSSLLLLLDDLDELPKVCKNPA